MNNLIQDIELLQREHSVIFHYQNDYKFKMKPASSFEIKRLPTRSEYSNMRFDWFTKYGVDLANFQFNFFEEFDCNL